MGFSAIDYAVLLLYLVGITAFGTLFRKGQKSVKDYFVGTKNTSWLVISLSIVATETSTLTLIGVPAIAYAKYARPEQGGNLTYLQVVFGYIVARFIISLLLLPAYFQGDLLTAYELLKKRFGVGAKNFAASLFLIMRALAEGLRVFAASLVLSAVLQASLPNFPYLWLWSIIIVGLLTLVYTFEGGIAAVIWTDLIQLVIYIGGSLLAAYELLHLVPGGWTTIAAEANRVGKFQIFSFSWDFTVPFTFWAGLIGGTFLTMASHGTDQLLVQRLLTCRDKRDGQKALIFSGFVVLFQFALFLIIGVMLYSYYNHFPLTAKIPDDQIFPEFIVQRLPHGVSGLVIAAIFAAAMSNLSGSLNSLASTTVLDFYKPLINPRASDEFLLKLSRYSTAAWGLILIVIAIGASKLSKSVLQDGLSIASVVYGAMLGAFLLGVLTKRANGRGVMCGMATSLVLMVIIYFLPRVAAQFPQTFPAALQKSIAWTWYVALGTIVCFSVGYVVSLTTKTDISSEPKSKEVFAAD